MFVMYIRLNAMNSCKCPFVFILLGGLAKSYSRHLSIERSICTYVRGAVHMPPGKVLSRNPVVLYLHDSFTLRECSIPIIPDHFFLLRVLPFIDGDMCEVEVPNKRQEQDRKSCSNRKILC